MPAIRRTAAWVALVIGLTASGCANDSPTGTPAGSQLASSPADPAATTPTSSVGDVVDIVASGAELPVEARLIPGAMVLIRIGDQVRVVTEGKAEMSPARPMRAQLRFPVASETKPMVAALAMELVEDGTLSLDDTVEQWAPGLLPSGSSITVEQLLSHRSGLPDYFDLVKLDSRPARGQIPAEDLVELVADKPLDFEPGTATKYSNTGFIVLGLVIEAATGDTLAESLQDRVFDPLQMSQTSLGRGGPPDRQDVHGYAKKKDTTRTAVTEAGLADSGVISTLADLNRFWRGLLEGQLVPLDTVHQMTTRTGPVEWADYGMGVAIRDTRCGRAFGHSGSIFGYAVSAWTLADADRSAVAMVNRNDDAYSIDFSETFSENALCQ